ncbi:PT domain-containing protein [Catellatospora sichuanensis]|uniref:PT domain-containing protein n=1 Tax=Catellatospora sichuanensis TaxID=1969805 RepID=UPI0011826BB0|nr:PT domain-containing protein [Catellatospora sichuanensis]
MRHPRAALTAAVAIAVLGLAAACGSGDDTTDQTASGGQASGFAAYTACLKEQGITLPEGFGQGQGQGRPSGAPTARPTNQPTARPTVRPSGQPGGFGGPGGGMRAPDGVDAEKWQQAQQACVAVRPSGGPGGGFGGNRGDNGANAAYRNCLAERGVEFTPGQQLATADPKVAAAMQACAVLRPTTTPSPAAS